jgi:hypothetical protein
VIGLRDQHQRDRSINIDAQRISASTHAVCSSATSGGITIRAYTSTQNIAVDIDGLDGVV